MIAALVPLKRLDLAKSRLAAALGRDAARALALAMLDDVLAPLVASPRIAITAVVTEDEDAAAAARRAGARALVMSDLGLDACLDAAAAQLAAEGAQAVLIVLGDVAGIDAGDVNALLDALHELGERGVVLAASDDGGTAALLRAPHDVIPSRFGGASAAAHRAAARMAGVPLREVARPGLSIDLDGPDDLAALRRLPGGARRTRALIAAREVAHP